MTAPHSWPRFVEALSAATSNVRARERHLTASCPSSDHPDRNPSFSADLEPDGSIRFCCHSRGCRDEVLAAIGWTWADLRLGAQPTPVPATRDRAAWVEPQVFSAWIDASHRRLVDNEPDDRDRLRARLYLLARGVDPEQARRYRLGFGAPCADSPALDALAHRIVYARWPSMAEGRRLPDVVPARHKAREKHTAAGCAKRWWQADVVDVSGSVVLVEGVFDALAVDRLVPGQVVACLSKSNVRRDDLALLANRGCRRLYLGLDRDLTLDEWRKWVQACRDVGIDGRPVVGPHEGDWNDLVRRHLVRDEAGRPLRRDDGALEVSDGMYRELSEALATPTAPEVGP